MYFKDFMYIDQGFFQQRGVFLFLFLNNGYIKGNYNLVLISVLGFVIK